MTQSDKKRSRVERKEEPHGGDPRSRKPTVYLQLIWEGEPTLEALSQLSRENGELDLVLSRAPSEIPRPSRPRRRFLHRFPIPRPDGGILYLPVWEIDWIEGANQYARLHTDDGTFLVRETLSHILTRLDPEHFLRVHRSAIANVHRIRELRPDSPRRRWAVLKNGTHLRVSASYWEALMESLPWLP